MFCIFVSHIRLCYVCGSAGSEATPSDQKVVDEDHYREGKKLFTCIVLPLSQEL